MKLQRLCVIAMLIFMLSTIYLICFPKVKTEIVIKEIEKPVEIEKIIEIEKPIEVEPSYAFQITSVERELLARLVFREANVESIECQRAVVSVVINRWKNGYCGNTITDVIYSKGQFTPAYLLWKTTPTEENYRAVDEVLKYGCTLEAYVMYFRANYGFSQEWDDYSEYVKINNTYFGYMNHDKE